MEAERLALPGRDASDRPALGDPGTDPVESFRRFLRLETERLRMRHRMGLGGAEIAGGRSDQVDLVVTRVCQISAEDADPDARRELVQCAVVALGGYGRRELAPHSDVDLLFLHGGKVSPGLRRFVERALQLLWDVGLNVGHAVRSVGTLTCSWPQAMCGLGVCRWRCGGSSWCCKASTTLIKPAIPAAASRCPILVLTEPRSSRLAVVRPSPSTAPNACTSMGSPSAVPVPCAST